MANYIYNEAKDLINSAKTRDVYELCDYLDIHIYKNSNLKKLLGFYTIVNGRKAIVVNSNKDDLTQRQVIAHEIGHAVLHNDYIENYSMIKEFELMDMRTKPEYEANVFASHILISDKDIEDVSMEYDDYQSIASALGVNINMLMIKILELNKLGKNYNEMFIPKGDFLK
ncbi:MAG: ImmA/IrrE family metallo-endopeptidase [Tissierellia bacterium]|nr:ImmA/IrrE family metallo-endopeptidase [Tissierellia bacterium]